MDDLRVYNYALTAAQVLALSQPAFTFPNAVNPAPVAGATAYTWICAAGAYGSSATIQQNPGFNTWAWVGGSQPNCVPCPAGQYSYAGSAGCNSCPAGFGLISPALGCAPIPGAGPTDSVVFYHTGAAGEGTNIFSGLKSGVSFTTDRLNTPNAAMAFAGGSYLSTTAGALALPSGDAAVSVSAMVRCASTASTATQDVIMWGKASVASARAGLFATAPTVSVSNQPFVSSIAGPITRSSDGYGTAASFYYPVGVAADPFGNVVIGEAWQGTIRAFSITTGYVQTIVPTTAGIQVQGVAADGNYNYYLPDLNTCRILIYNGTTGLLSPVTTGGCGFTDGACSVATFNSPRGVVASLDSTTIYVADLSNNAVRKISNANSPATCTVSTLGGGSPLGAGYADGQGTNALFNALREASASAIDGSVVVGDYGNNCIRRVSASGLTTTVAGNGLIAGGYKDGVSTGAVFNGPRSVTMLLNGDMYVADAYNHLVRKVFANGVVVTFAGGGGTPTTGGYAPAYGRFDATGSNALFHGPASITSDANNNIYVCDNGNMLIRKITPAAVVTTLLGNGNGAPFNIVPLNYPAGSAYIAMGATMGSNNNYGTSAQLFYARGVTGDSQGNLYVADSGNNLIRKVSMPSQYVSYFAGTPPPAAPFYGGQQPGVAGFANSATALAASFNSPWGVVSDVNSTALFVVDTGNNAIRKIAMPSVGVSGAVTTLAGQATAGILDGVGAVAKFNAPRGVAINAAATTLYVCDAGNNAIRAVTIATGAVVTIAGSYTGVAGNTNGVGTNAKFSKPSGAVVDPVSGDLFVADTANSLVRRVTLAAGASQYTVSTYAGGGIATYADATVPANVYFNQPYAITVDKTGANFYVADTLNNYVRVLTGTAASSFASSTYAGMGPAGTAGRENDGYGVNAGMTAPISIYVDANGAAYTLDYYSPSTLGVSVIPAVLSPISDTSVLRQIVPGLAAFPICDGVWHHVATTHSTAPIDTSVFYLDGVAMVTQLVQPWAVSPALAQLNIGWNGDKTTSVGELFSGAVSELRVYSRALSAQEVLTLSQPPIASYPNAVVPTLSAGKTFYSTSCQPGYAGPNVNFTKVAATGAWTVTGSGVSCQACPAGYYTVTGNTTACIACPAGSFGGSAAMPSAACSGTCNAGYYCPPASTSATQLPCGGASVYCPAGSAAPVPVPAGFYSAPLNAPANGRSAICTCGAGGSGACASFTTGRACSAGVLLPAIDLSASCYGGNIYVELTDAMKNQTFGQLLTAAVPGMASPAVTWAVTATPADGANCTNPGIISSVQSGLNFQLAVSLGGSATINANGCGNGITYQVTPSRATVSASDSVYSTGLTPYQPTCTVNVLVQAALAPPVIQSCANVAVPERQPANTRYGVVVAVEGAGSVDTLSYAIQSATASPNPGVSAPFGIDCTGSLFSTRSFLYATASSYNLTVRVDNTAGGLVFSSYCSLLVGIVPQPIAPTLTTNALSTYDLQPAGTIVGSLGLINNNNVVGQLVNYTSVAAWSAVDSPNAFNISASGVVAVARAVLDVTQKATYYYSVNVSDGVASAVYPVTISLLATARPPAAFPQIFSINQGSLPGSLVPGGQFLATHPQLKDMTYALVQPSFPFVMNSSGYLSVSVLATASPPTLNFNVQPTYQLFTIITDTSGKSLTVPTTVQVLNTPLAPTFPVNYYSYSVVEGGPGGAQVGAPLYATNANPNDPLQYAITGCTPLLYNPLVGASVCPFTIDLTLGQIKVVSGLPGNQLRADLNNSLFNPSGPFVYTVSATSFVSAGLRTTVPVYITVVNIAPRWNATTIAQTVARTQQRAGSVFLNLANWAWVPSYTSPASAGTAAQLAYYATIPGGAYAATAAVASNFTFTSGFSPVNSFDGVPAFSIFASTGALSVNSVAGAGPQFNVNIQPTFTFQVSVQDTRVNTVSTTTIVLTMEHINRAPFFNATLMRSMPFPLPLANTGPVGPLVTNFAGDLDLGVLTTEVVTYSLGANCGAVACNGTSLGLTISSTGQITVPASIVGGLQCGAYTCTSTTGPWFALNVTMVDAGIDSVPAGLQLSASAIVYVMLVAGLSPPQFSPASYAFSVPENTPFYTAINPPAMPSNPTLAATTAMYSTVSLSYTLSAAGTNALADFPFAVATVCPATRTSLNACQANLTIFPWPGNPVWVNLDFEAPTKLGALAGFRTYAATATAKDTNVPPMSATVPVTITITDVPEAPYFSPSRVPGSMVWNLQILENTPLTNAAGAIAYNTIGTTISASLPSGATVVTTSLAASGPGSAANPVFAFDDDAGDNPAGTCCNGTGKLVYSWAPGQPAAVLNLFAINPSTGQITGGAGANTGVMGPTGLGGLNYELNNSYTLYALVTDTTGRTDVATVNIAVVDVNEVASISAFAYNGLKTLGGVSQSTFLVAGGAVDQTSSATAGVAVINATDPDAATGTGGRGVGGLSSMVSYSFVQPAGQPPVPFSITPKGLIQVNAYGSGNLIWENQVFYRYQIAITDGSAQPLTLLVNVTFQVMGSNSIVVNLVSVLPASVLTSNGGTSATNDLGLNIAPGVPNYAALFAQFAPMNVYALFRVAQPAGASAGVVLTGLNFGPTANRIANSGEGLSATNWVVSVTYGPTGVEYAATGCSVTTPNTVITCTGIQTGGGGPHKWNVTITYPATIAGGGPNPILPSGPVTQNTVASQMTAYMPATIASVYVSSPGSALVASANTMPTSGNTPIFISGKDLGPPIANKVPISVSYYPYTTVAGSCFVATPEVAGSPGLVNCTSSQGVGPAPFPWLITVGGVQSLVAFNASVVSYAPPSIANVSSTTAPAQGLSTLGGDTIVIQGANFGPAGAVFGAVPQPGAAFATSPAFAIYYASASQWGAPYGTATAPWVYGASACVITTPHTVITCTRGTAAGVGAALRWVAVIGAQGSTAAASLALGYAPPVITALSGATSMAATAGGDVIYVTGTSFGPVTTSAAQPQPLANYGKGSSNAFAALKYGAVNCAVTSAATASGQMTCYTAPGTGAGLFWAVSVGGQVSSTFLGSNTSYSPPILAYYAGPKSTVTTTPYNTPGGEIVNLVGTNFGPLGTPITSVTYGQTYAATPALTGKDFTATNCSVVVPHTQINCTTAAGAGANLIYLVTVDGQLNVVPTASYGVPVITSISGMSGGSTDGGDVVVLTGQYFSTNQWFISATYGPTGAEYNASGCRVSVPHTQITCVSVPGTGRALTWVVNVRGQFSQRSAVTTSYAPPVIASVAPANGPTAGGTVVTLTGTNFGLALKSNSIQVLINAFQSPAVPQPPAAGVSAYLASVYAGTASFAGAASSDATGTAQWLASMLPFSPAAFGGVITARSNHSVNFYLPRGFGTNVALLLVVGGVPSNVVSFNYDPPQITNISPDRIGVTAAGFLRVVVEGVNFCTYAYGCGQLFVNGVQIAAGGVPTSAASPQSLIASNWTDTRLVSFLIDPATLGAGVQSVVQVQVGNLTSNAVAFSAPVPAFDVTTGQGNWGGGAAPSVSAAVVAFSISMTGAAVTGASVNTLAVGSPLRAAMAAAAGVSSASVTLVAVTDIATGVVTQVGPTSPVNTVNGKRRLGVQNGVNVSVSINLVKASTSHTPPLLMDPDSIAALTASVTAALSAPAYMNSVTVAVARALGVNVSSVTGRVQVASIQAPPPTVSTKAAGSAIPTTGGTPFFIAGVMSLYNFYPVGAVWSLALPLPAPVPVPASAGVSISIGPNNCLNLTMQPDGDLSANYGISPSNPMFYTFQLACVTPPGVGENLPIIITTSVGQSNNDPNFQFSYAAPNTTDIVDVNCLPAGSGGGQSLTTPLNPATGLSLYGVPAVGGCNVKIVGSNFAPLNLTAGLPAPMQIIARLYPDSGLPPVVVPVISQSFTSVTIGPLPPGVGANLWLSLSVGGQLDTDPIAGGGAQAPLTLRYRTPSVVNVFGFSGSQLGPTVGGTPITITGADFGPVSPAPAELPVVTFGPTADGGGPWTATVTAQTSDSQLLAVLPQGWGKNVPVVVTVGGQVSLNVSYSYAPPTVTSVSPAFGPTSGLDIDGNVINMTLTGTNLGQGGYVVFTPTAASASALPIVVPASAIYFHNDTLVTFPMPMGVGANMIVAVVAGGQDSVATSPNMQFSYLASPPRPAAAPLFCRPAPPPPLAPAPGRRPASHPDRPHDTRAPLAAAHHPEDHVGPRRGPAVRAAARAGARAGLRRAGVRHRHAARLPGLRRLVLPLRRKAAEEHPHQGRELRPALGAAHGENRRQRLPAGPGARPRPQQHLLHAAGRLRRQQHGHDLRRRPRERPLAERDLRLRPADRRQHHAEPAGRHQWPAHRHLGPQLRPERQPGRGAHRRRALPGRRLGQRLGHPLHDAAGHGRRQERLRARGAALGARLLLRGRVAGYAHRAALPQGLHGPRGRVLHALPGLRPHRLNRRRAGRELPGLRAPPRPRLGAAGLVALQLDGADAVRLAAPGRPHLEPEPGLGLAGPRGPGQRRGGPGLPRLRGLPADGRVPRPQHLRGALHGRPLRRVRGPLLPRERQLHQVPGLAVGHGRHLRDPRHPGHDVRLHAQRQEREPLAHQHRHGLGADRGHVRALADQVAGPRAAALPAALGLQLQPRAHRAAVRRAEHHLRRPVALRRGYAALRVGHAARRLRRAPGLQALHRRRQAAPLHAREQPGRHGRRRAARALPLHDAQHARRLQLLAGQPAGLRRGRQGHQLHGLPGGHQVRRARRHAAVPAALRRRRAGHLRRRPAAALALVPAQEQGEDQVRPGAALAAHRRRQGHEPALRAAHDLQGALHELPPGVLVLGVRRLRAQVPHRLLQPHVPRDAELPAGHGAARALRGLRAAGAHAALPQPRARRRDLPRVQAQGGRGLGHPAAHLRRHEGARGLLQEQPEGERAPAGRQPARRRRGGRARRRRARGLLRLAPLGLREAGAQWPSHDPAQPRRQLHVRLQYGRGRAARQRAAHQPRRHLLRQQPLHAGHDGPARHPGRVQQPRLRHHRDHVPEHHLLVLRHGHGHPARHGAGDRAGLPLEHRPRRQGRALAREEGRVGQGRRGRRQPRRQQQAPARHRRRDGGGRGRPELRVHADERAHGGRPR